MEEFDEPANVRRALQRHAKSRLEERWAEPSPNDTRSRGFEIVLQTLRVVGERRRKFGGGSLMPPYRHGAVDQNLACGEATAERPLDLLLADRFSQESMLSGKGQERRVRVRLDAVGRAD